MKRKDFLKILALSPLMLTKLLQLSRQPSKPLAQPETVWATAMSGTFKACDIHPDTPLYSEYADQVLKGAREFNRRVGRRIYDARS